MYCILDENIALRSWQRTPYAYYIKHERDAKRLTKAEYELLSRCDGRQDIPESELLNALIGRGMARRCEKGAQLSPWQNMKCENRYFPAMNLMITGKCNYNCRHCFNAADNAPLQSEWTLPEALRLLDEAQACGINGFTITGGEPMLHKNFFEILEGIYARGMYVYELNTNGSFLKQRALERMRALGCVPLMKISFDGVGHHDWLRCHKNAEQDALRAIALCIENGFPVKVQTNVHRLNVGAMLDTARLLDKMGVDEMRIIRTTESPRWVENAHGAALELSEYYGEMVELLRKYAAEDHNMAMTVWQLGSFFPRGKSYVMAAVECCCGEYRASLPVCTSNRGMIAVGANGRVYPCHQMSGYYEQHGDVLGDLKTTPLREILSAGRYMDEICTTVGVLRENNSKCAACRHFEYCCGGCRAVALAMTGDKLGADPSKCLFWEGGWDEKLARALDGWENLTPIK